MFFEPLGTENGPTTEERPTFPVWSAPPSSETGGVIALERIIARSANVVVLLPSVRVFRSGCMLEIEVVSRQGDLSEEDWWDLSMWAHGFGPPVGRQLPDKLLRMGVRYRDGTKVTTIEQHRETRLADQQPSGPLLTWWPEGGGPRGGGVFNFDRSTLWLWPLPPPEPFEFAVEWPLAGINLTTTELDGTLLSTAAARSTQFWPDDDAPAERD
ncbi:hypothetical protein [Actinomadura sp. 9N215]|uniref:hypothetical protein n=1 Tax=Actinomadura sp. 9N215 TaxID=3375150 RepID=UPI003789AA5F